MSDLKFDEIRGEPAMMALGQACADAWQAVANGRGMFVHLQGDLGAGKTTLVRAWLRGLGHDGAVRSPTYTLIEPYELETGPGYHLDLYRLGDPEELEYLGMRDLLAVPALCLVEWPERGIGLLPPADLTIAIEHAGEARKLAMSASTTVAERFLESLRGVSHAGI
ncbi:MAG: tRNA (adenosine(37)-N6)-threonylcarbamoyltransferase complex ATPase subunit type 1 TsaE [Gammaproteobacteria bacterium]|nr:tRNA (adenosine(37)-N6)-threonylcarbamoyltransferase complex ATPase subunit type 1 TsaE [Gammaproteobacteria bacterium]